MIPLSLMALSAEISFSPLRSADLPVREVFLGGAREEILTGMDSFDRHLLRLEAGYRDLYYDKKGDRLQDYHQSDIRLLHLFRTGRWVGGYRLGRNVLILKQDNLYSERDRLRGSAEAWNLEGLGGVDLPGPGRAGIGRLRAMGALGYRGQGVAGSIDTRLTWNNRCRLYLGAESYPHRIELSQSIAGHTFPFHFPFRTWGGDMAVMVPLELFTLELEGGMERCRGEGEEVKGFLNSIFWRTEQGGGTVSYRTERYGEGGRLFRKTTSASALPGFLFNLEHKTGYLEMHMYNRGVRYLHLKDFKTYFTGIELSLVPLRNSWLSLGWERTRVYHPKPAWAKDAFAAIWPFTIWDIFAAQEFVLGEVEASLDSWFIGAGTVIEGERLDIELLGRFDFLGDEGGVIWYQKEYLNYPFHPYFVPHDDRLDISPIYALQLQPAAELRIGEYLTLRISLEAYIPFGKKEDSGNGGTPSVTPVPRAEEEDSSRHGGLRGKIRLLYAF
ncbi:MAG: hypothetical protein JXB45_07705 [Candidatus Krumholzibacteriota bacterium]|nr:hypothetical protein [Candidatus Krumholzibacteriota bacterium]